MATEYISGHNMYLVWQYAGGSVILDADYTTCDFETKIDYAETTAGHDTQKGVLPTIYDATASIELVAQTGGTVVTTALLSGTAGTLLIGPEGSSSGKRKITLPAYSDGAKSSFPFKDVSKITCKFTGSSQLGAYSEGVF